MGAVSAGMVKEVIALTIGDHISNVVILCVTLILITNTSMVRFKSKWSLEVSRGRALH